MTDFEGQTQINIKALASLLSLTTRRVQQLADEGYIPRGDNKRYYLESAVRGYIKFLKSKNGGDGIGADYHAEKARLVKAQADKAEIDVQELNGELVRASEVSAVWYNTVTACKSRLLSIPSKAAPIVAAETNAGECQIIIDDLVREALEELSNYAISEQDHPEGDEGMESTAEANG
jgi:phage terminase Nu1 subunit (DNA packaging protein)